MATKFGTARFPPAPTLGLGFALGSKLGPFSRLAIDSYSSILVLEDVQFDTARAQLLVFQRTIERTILLMMTATKLGRRILPLH